MTAFRIHDWEWPGAAWEKIEDVAPHPGFGTAVGALIYDLAENEVVMVSDVASGASFPGDPADLLGLTAPAFMVRDSALEWSEQSPSTFPTSLAFFEFAYDEANARGVLVNDDSETWTRDGSTGEWTLESPGTTATADAFGQPHGKMVYDQVRERVVLLNFPGLVINPITVKEWDGSDWAFVATGPFPDANNEAFSIGWDSTNGKIVYFNWGNGETWTRSGLIWTQESPTNSPGNAPLLLCDSPPNNGVLALQNGNGTWVWDDSDWTQLFDTQEPDAPLSPYDMMVWDPDRARVFAPGFYTEVFLGELNHAFGLG